MVGFGVLVLFQANVKPTRVIVGAELAETWRLSGKPMTASRLVIMIMDERKNMDSLLLSIESHDWRRRLITLPDAAKTTATSSKQTNL